MVIIIEKNHMIHIVEGDAAEGSVGSECRDELKLEMALDYHMFLCIDCCYLESEIGIQVMVESCQSYR